MPSPKELEKRHAVLKRLVAFDRPLEDVMQELRGFSWDSDEELLQLEASHLIQVLRGYVDGAASAEEVEAWANAIEGREDIGYQGKVLEAVHVLANPVLEGELTRDLASKLIQQLGAGERGRQP